MTTPRKKHHSYDPGAEYARRLAFYSSIGDQALLSKARAMKVEKISRRPRGEKSSPGVRWDEALRSWKVQVLRGGERHQIGLYKNYYDAKYAYLDEVGA